MTLKYIFLLVSFFIINSLAAQKKSSFAILLGSDYHLFEMKELKNNFSNDYLEESNIQNGLGFYINTIYQPSKMFDFGVYGSYQSGNTKSTPSFYKMDEYNLPISECQGKYELSTEAYAVGVNSTLYFNQFLFDQNQKTFIDRIQLGVEAAAGLGFSKVISDLQPPRGSTASKEFLYYNSQDFQGKIGLKVEYNFTKQPLITSLGIKGGYQYSKPNP